MYFESIGYENLIDKSIIKSTKCNFCDYYKQISIYLLNIQQVNFLGKWVDF